MNEIFWDFNDYGFQWYITEENDIQDLPWYIYIEQMIRGEEDSLEAYYTKLNYNWCYPELSLHNPRCQATFMLQTAILEEPKSI